MYARCTLTFNMYIYLYMPTDFKILARVKCNFIISLIMFITAMIYVDIFILPMY